ncbi:MarR family winged helix-turn-helix transcriptional regulator [Hephaestia sp. GCM10023244]|uniref:MarR family winged helix-turn-helix transcriptional regulator n=1 Tax=unclassified Hephaestia TaxID=2631281 RepID=UPI00207730CF|nr:MarR family winged helix-turn-helix transcriptional regulator [Hephaestia sp. MAHUQ-44]MCM8730996.1 MarR family winged helix-turn-helix transcriptional regulator [Hephaestia sp. MAHUQ-44]
MSLKGGSRALALDHFIPYRMSFTSNLVSDLIARTYDALFGLTIPEWRLVAVIAETGGITQGEICQRTRMDKVTVSRAAIALVNRGLLDRLANEGDRRSHHLVLTEAGRTLHATIAPKALGIEQRIFAHFAPEESERFVAMLRRIDAIALELAEEEEQRKAREAATA